MQHRISLVFGLTLSFLGALAVSAHAEPIGEFSPGVWLDGKPRTMDQLRGRVVVLYFFRFESGDDSRQADDVQRLAERHADDPVVFVGVGVSPEPLDLDDTPKALSEAMPLFFDRFGITADFFGIDPPRRGTSQTLIIDGNGEPIGRGLSPRRLAWAIEKLEPVEAEPRWKAEDYADALAGVVEHANQGHLRLALRQARARQARAHPELQASAEQLEADLLAQGVAMVQRAESLIATHPLQAYDLFDVVRQAFGSDAPGQAAEVAMEQLEKVEAVREELAARELFEPNAKMLENSPPSMLTWRVRGFERVAKEHPGTPTAEKAARIVRVVKPYAKPGPQMQLPEVPTARELRERQDKDR